MRQLRRTNVTDVAAIVRVMKNKPVLDLDVAQSPASPSIWRSAATGAVQIFKNVLLPHLAAGFGILLICVYVGYEVFIVPHVLPGFVQAILVGGLLVVYGALALGYSILAACTFAFYEACVAWEDFIAYLLDCVQEKALAQLENMDESLAKDQAKVLIRGSVREVLRTVKQQELTAWPRWLASLCLGGLVLAMRSVLVARIIKWSGTTVKLSKIFAGKATLVGAIFLNLRFFALLLLGIIYGIGGIFLLFQGCLFWWGK